MVVVGLSVSSKATRQHAPAMVASTACAYVVLTDILAAIGWEASPHFGGQAGPV